jgi:hypothetical protein
VRTLLLVLLAGLAWGAEVNKVHITPSECQQHQMAPLDLSVDATGTALRPIEFPEKGVYLRLSGPPGGPLLFEVMPGPMEESLKLRFKELTLDERMPCKAKLLGQQREGITFLVGSSHARTRWTVLQLPKIIVLFGASPGWDPLAHPDLAPLAASLELKP